MAVPQSQILLRKYKHLLKKPIFLEYYISMLEKEILKLKRCLELAKIKLRELEKNES